MVSKQKYGFVKKWGKAGKAVLYGSFTGFGITLLGSFLMASAYGQDSVKSSWFAWTFFGIGSLLAILYSSAMWSLQMRADRGQDVASLWKAQIHLGKEIKKHHVALKKLQEDFDALGSIR